MHITDSKLDSENIANVVGALVWALGDAIRAATHAQGRERNAISALVHLDKYPGETLDALRAPLDLSHSGCVRLIDRLAAAGYVERRPGLDDGRSVSVHLTRTGAAAARRALAARGEVLKQALSILTPTEQESLGRIALKIVPRTIQSSVSALRVCRLCDDDACATCHEIGATVDVRTRYKGPAIWTGESHHLFRNVTLLPRGIAEPSTFQATTRHCLLERTRSTTRSALRRGPRLICRRRGDKSARRGVAARGSPACRVTTARGPSGTIASGGFGHPTFAAGGRASGSRRACVRCVVAGRQGEGRRQNSSLSRCGGPRTDTESATRRSARCSPEHGLR